MEKLTPLIDDLNVRLMALERRATAKNLIGKGLARLTEAERSLEVLSLAYIEGDAAERRVIQQRTGFDPTLRVPLRDVIRRWLTIFPKARGDYRDALWCVTLTYGARSAREIVETRSAAPLTRALAALCIEGGRYDSRDTKQMVDELREAAARAGVDAACHFRLAIEWAGDTPIRCILQSAI